MKTKLVNIAAVFEILGEIDGDSAALVHRLIYAYNEYNTDKIMLGFIENKGHGYRPTNADLEEKTMGFARHLFDKSLYMSSDIPPKKGFYAYFWKNYCDDFPQGALSKHNDAFSVLKGQRQKATFLKRLKVEIITLSKLLDEDSDKVLEEMDDHVLSYTRFPIVYYFFSKKRLRKTVSQYLESRIIIEKFIYGALIKELKLTRIPIEEIKVAFGNIINKEQYNAKFSEYLWETIYSELTEERIKK